MACAITALAALHAMACTEPAEATDPVVVIPGDAALDMAAPDAGPPDAAPDARPPARALVERPPLPSPAHNRVLNPGFDPRAPGSWLADPPTTRLVDHRLPFAGPAIAVPGDGEVAIYGRVRLSAEPLVLSLWIGVEPGADPAEAHAGNRAQAQFVAFTPDRDPIDFVAYQLLPTDEMVMGPHGRLWRRFEGGARRPTLGWGWLLIFGGEGTRLGIGDPIVLTEAADPNALRRRVPEMPARAVDPAVRARLDALATPPPPRPRPTRLAPRGLDRRR